MNTKVVVFDFDGTLSKPSKLPNSWARVWDRIGCQEEDEKLYKLYSSGKITYREWTNLVLDIYKREKVSEIMLKDISNETILISGLGELLKFFKNNSVDVYILSGGIKNIIEFSLLEYMPYIKKIEADKLIFNENRELTNIDFVDNSVENKSLFIFKIMEKLNLKSDEIVFVGNGSNDEDVYKTGVKTICINPDDADFKNTVKWNHCIENCGNIMDILKFID